MIYSIPFELNEIVLLKVTKKYINSLNYTDLITQEVIESEIEHTILGKIVLLEDNPSGIITGYKYLYVQIISNSINSNLNRRTIYISPNEESAWYLPLENITKLN